MKITALAATLATLVMAQLRSGCDPSPRPLSLAATAVPLSQDAGVVTVGKLHYRGGLELDSEESAFGGLSAIVVSDDGNRFVAVTDESHWITGRLEYENGNLAGATGDRIAPLLSPDGKALRGKRGDAEGLTTTSAALDGDLFVSFEGDDRVWRYPFGRDGVDAVPSDVPLPASLHSAPANEGIEGLTRIADGRLLAMSERFADDAGDYRAWLLPAPSADGAVPTTPAIGLALRPNKPFALTDVRQLDDGDLLILERRYHPDRGVGMQMRRIPASLVHEGAILDGEVIADMGAGFSVDNMEGLSVRRGIRGETLLYLLSDDNFNTPAQRTLLLMFELLN